MKNHAFITAAFSLFLSASAFGQGALTPPGAPAPTMKSLNQVEPRTPITNLPFTIYSSGSYYLTTSLSNNGDTNAITIAASGVTVDLMGYTLTGVGVGSEKAIQQTFGDRATVRNGVITAFTTGGIALRDYASVENIQVSNCGGYGIVVGYGSSVQDVQAVKNIGGISLGRQSRLIDSIILGSTSAHGVYALQGCLVSGSISSSNNLSGFSFVQNALIRDSSADFNGNNGIYGQNGLVVTDCRAYDNAQNGIYAVSNGLIRSCFAAGNNIRQLSVGDKGIIDSCYSIGTIDAFGSNIVVRNTIHDGSVIINSDTVSGSSVWQMSGNPSIGTDRPMSNLRYDP